MAVLPVNRRSSPSALNCMMRWNALASCVAATLSVRHGFAKPCVIDNGSVSLGTNLRFKEEG